MDRVSHGDIPIVAVQDVKQPFKLTIIQIKRENGGRADGTLLTTTNITEKQPLLATTNIDVSKDKKGYSHKTTQN